MRKLMILGSGGMLGHIVTMYFKSFPGDFDVIDVARHKHAAGPSVLLDATDFDRLRSLFGAEQPDIIINCIGILNMNAENNPLNAILTNSYLPHYLEKLTFNTGCRVIHISTDCVFSGRTGGYRENDFMDGDGYYARTKALGEICNGKDLTIRTSIIGPELSEHGIGLFRWFAASSGEVKGYDHVYWTGITTVELARALRECIEHDISGIYHMVNNHRVSKYELLQIFREVFNSQVTGIVKSAEKAYDKSLLNTRKDLSYTVPDYHTMVIAMKQWIEQHPDTYPHYRHLFA